MDTKGIRRYLLAFGILLPIDLAWIFVVMKDFYAAQLNQFAKPEVVPIWAAVLVWLLIPLGIVVFVDRLAKTGKESLIYGALYGLIIYAVYDLTNYTTLGGWSLSLVIVDIMWGTVLCSTTSLLVKIGGKKWLR